MRHHYEGCKLQKYLGQTVEWCFCSGAGGGGDDVTPCNGQSRGSMGGGMLEYVSESHDEYDGLYGSNLVTAYDSHRGVYKSDVIGAKQGADDASLCKLHQISAVMLQN